MGLQGPADNRTGQQWLRKEATAARVRVIDTKRSAKVTVKLVGRKQTMGGVARQKSGLKREPVRCRLENGKSEQS